MTSMHSEQPRRPAGCSGMETTTQYRRFAEECRRLAGEARTERHREMLEEMAQAWEKLAREAEQESSHALS